VIGTYEYDAFGSVRTHTGVSTEWTFTGEQNDPASLEYLRARYYDPAIGRFLSRDPFAGLVAVPQSLNRYACVLSNPLLYRDPFGYWGLGDVWDKAKDVAGAAAESVAAGGEWLGEDYHWATVGAAVGGTAFVGGVILLTAPVSAPLLTTALLSGGMGVGVPLTILSVAHSGKECASGDKGACVSAGVGGVSGPLGFYPGGAGVALVVEWLPVATDVGISAWRALSSQGEMPKE
jgi:RHS repeat-associated protein